MTFSWIVVGVLNLVKDFDMVNNIFIRHKQSNWIWELLFLIRLNTIWIKKIPVSRYNNGIPDSGVFAGFPRGTINYIRGRFFKYATNMHFNLFWQIHREGQTHPLSVEHSKNTDYHTGLDQNVFLQLRAGVGKTSHWREIPLVDRKKGS